MIQDPKPWKQELLRIASRLELRYNQKRWSAQSAFLLEKELFLGFFAVRKLFDSQGCHHGLEVEKLELAMYPVGDKEITLLNTQHFAELYNLYANKREKLTFRQVANQFVHSSICVPFTPWRKSLVGVYIASDLAKKQKLYYIPLNKIVEVFRSVARDRRLMYSVDYDKERKAYVVSQAH